MIYGTPLYDLLKHPELRGYVPNFMETMDIDIGNGQMEECVKMDDIMDLLKGIVAAYQDGTISDLYLLDMVPRAKKMLRALQREEIAWEAT